MNKPAGAGDWLPDAHFGTATSPLPAPIPADKDVDPDDERLDHTPPDVVMMLGFDPAKVEGFDKPDSD